MAELSNLYAGVAGYFGKKDHSGKVGVFRRTTAGGDWQHVLGAVQAFTVFVHPKNPEIVFAGTNDGVWRSTDRGATFRRTAFPDASREVWLYVAISAAGAFRSDDGGASWRRLPTPAIDIHCKGPFASRVMRLVQHPKRHDEIYAALEINGVMRSIDLGQNWTDCSAGLMKLAEHEHLKSKIVSDTTAEGMLDSHAITINPAMPDALWIAVRMGLFQSCDQGHTWKDMEVGRFSPTTYGRDIRVSPVEPNTLYSALSVAAASHDGGLYRSEDGGESWQRFDKVQVHGTIMSIGLHPTDAGQVYLGARYDGEIYGTRDAGKSWQAMPLPGEVQHIYSLACG